MKPAAILDIDGTLVDTNYHHALAWFRAFKQHEVFVPIWRVHRAVGMGGDQLVAEVGGDEVEEELGDTIRTAEKAHYATLIQDVIAMKGAAELISALSERGHEVVLASSAKPDEVEHYVGLLDGAREVVQGWTSKEDVEATKPQPDLVKAAVDKVEADEAVLIGDTTWDCIAAADAGVPFVGMLTGGFSEAELRETGAVAVFESIDELRSGLDQTPLG